MGERVENRLNVFGNPSDILSFREKVKGTMVRYQDDGDEVEVQHLCFDKLIPVPDHLRQRTRWGYAEAAACGAPHNAYDGDPAESGGAWEEQHWGCRYGPLNCSTGETGSPIALYYYFETRNAVPIEAFSKIALLYPNLRFELRWLAEWEAFSVEHLATFEGDYCRHFSMVEDIKQSR